MIQRTRHLLPKKLPRGLGVMRLHADMVAGANGTPTPKDLVSTLSAPAVVNHGRWIVRCPWCPSATMADPSDPRFFCHECFNAAIQGIWLNVTFPPNYAAIENVLGLRPIIDNRNWEAPETLAFLKQENRENGLE